MRPIQTRDFKLAILPLSDARSREKRVVISPEFLFTEVGYPCLDNSEGFIAYGKEVGIEGLAKFSPNIPGVLMDTPCD